jgi:hypothetical protein
MVPMSELMEEAEFLNLLLHSVFPNITHCVTSEKPIVP